MPRSKTENTVEGVLSSRRIVFVVCVSFIKHSYDMCRTETPSDKLSCVVCAAGFTFTVFGCMGLTGLFKSLETTL